MMINLTTLLEYVRDNTQVPFLQGIHFKAQNTLNRVQ